jgi:hypothetical protein
MCRSPTTLTPNYLINERKCLSGLTVMVRLQFERGVLDPLFRGGGVTHRVVNVPCSCSIDRPWKRPCEVSLTPRPEG